jgi:phosphatidylglycerophosphate synthase
LVVKNFLVRRSEIGERRTGPYPQSRLWVEFVLAILSGTALVVALGSEGGTSSGLALSLAIYGLGVSAAALGMHRSYPYGELGLCNLVTLSRLALTASLAALVVSPAPLTDAEMWRAFAIAVTALLLDGVDGWAARRAGLASRFGARFDLEVDSVFALLLALLAYRTGEAGLWVIALGLPRYLFLAAGAIWPALRRELPERLSRKAVCVLQLGTLVAFLVPVLPPAATVTAAVVTLLALTWSFLTDIHRLAALGR